MILAVICWHLLLQDVGGIHGKVGEFVLLETVQS